MLFLNAIISNDAVVFGLLIATLALIFYSEKFAFFKGVYKYLPILLVAYFVPAIFNSTGLISGEDSNLYFVASRYLLPASLILLTLSIDLQAVRNLGSKAIIMFLAATLGIVLGGPIALWFVSLLNPELLSVSEGNEIWRGLATIAGSWIGGGANQTAMKEIYQTPDALFSAMLIVDIFVANLWMAFLLFGAGRSNALDRLLKADNSAIEELKKKVQAYQAQISRVLNFTDLFVLLGLTFGIVGLSHLLGDILSPSIGGWIETKLSEDENSWVRFVTSFGSHFFWLIVLATTGGVILSFTPARKYEGIGASKIGSVFIYILVATIGMKMDFYDLYLNWSTYKYFIIIGLVWMLVHVVILLLVAFLIRAPFFFVAVGSQANVGGAASAPIVASAFNPALAPVGALLAVVGYALGTFAAILCAMMMSGI